MTDAEKKMAEDKARDVERAASRWAESKADLGCANECLAIALAQAERANEEVANAARNLGGAQAAEIVAREKFHTFIGYVDIPF